jgi:hypothetical protein
MKHAGSAALDELEDLISKIRARSEFREPRRGVFYLKGRACLHFHEDASGLFADLREGEKWKRFPVSNAAQRNALISAVGRCAGGSKSKPKRRG